MNRRFLLAVIVGVFAILVATQLGPKKPDSVVKPGGEQKTVEAKKAKALVLKVDLVKGAKFNETLVELKDFPETDLPADFLKDPSEVAGKEATRPLEKGTTLTKGMVKKAEVISSLSDDIPKGKRAMTIKVDEIAGVGGFIQQGDLVDVVGMFTDAKSLPFTEPVKTILVGVRILAVGYDFETGPETPVPGAPPTPAPGQKPGQQGQGGNRIQAKKFPHVTVAVTLEEAEILALVADKAKFRLLLRSQKDKALTNEELAREKDTVQVMTLKEARDLSKGVVPAAPGQFGNTGTAARLAADPFAPDPSRFVRPTELPSPGVPVPSGTEAKRPREYKVDTFKGVQSPVTVTVKE